MTDPLGRKGYGLAAGPQNPGTQDYHPIKAVLIDPATGSLLATEDIGPMPRDVACLTYENLTSKEAARSGGRLIQLATVHGKPLMARCIGESFAGRSYSGQVDAFAALVSVGWTDTEPSLPPSAHEDPYGFFPGLPPADQ